MFHQHRQQTPFQAFIAICELVYHVTVRSVRSTHGNAILGLLLTMSQAIIMLGAFYVMFSLLGLRSAAIRGDFLLYLMSGVFLFITHNKGLSSVLGAEGPTSAMMKHAPMNTAIAISGSALAGLYTTILALLTILFLYHILWSPITILDPIPALGMLLLAWISGCSVGLVLLALKPWAPRFVGVLATIYQRANMIASGKMFVANALPANMLAMFDWNPLFHTIDQARGFIFINYFPHNSDIWYPVKFTLIFAMLGLMGEFFTRRRASLSWSARN